MGVYLVCDKCGNYYELQPGEKPEDFEKCQCGGSLHADIIKDRKYKTDEVIKGNKEKSNHTFTSKSKSRLFPCPDCGHEVSRKANKCSNCGRHLTEKDKGERNYFNLCCGGCLKP